MGICCDNIRNNFDKNEQEIVIDDSVLIREKIYKVFRLNPFYNFGSRRQLLLEKEFTSLQSEIIRDVKSFPILDFFNKYSVNYKILNRLEKIIIKYTLHSLNNRLKEFDKPENLFLNVLMFVLSNTKNNVDKKQEIILDIINASFFVSKNEKKIDLIKFKKYIKLLIAIAISIFLNFVILQVYESQENIPRLIYIAINPEDKSERNNISKNITEQLKRELNKNNFCYEKLINIWEEHLLSPIIFAGYSYEKNIATYNLNLRQEIMNRIINVFDCEKIINSIIHLKVE